MDNIFRVKIAELILSYIPDEDSQECFYEAFMHISGGNMEKIDKCFEKGYFKYLCFRPKKYSVSCIISIIDKCFARSDGLDIFKKINPSFIKAGITVHEFIIIFNDKADYLKEYFAKYDIYSHSTLSKCITGGAAK